MEKERIYIAGDHAGFELKEKIKKFLAENCLIEDLGAYEFDKEDDYPDYAIKLCKEVLEKNTRGILVCGSAHGMNIAANKLRGIRATICWNEKSAEYAKSHTDVNVICIPSRIISEEEAEKIIAVWLKTKFENAERHLRRLEKIKELEKENLID